MSCVITVPFRLIDGLVLHVPVYGLLLGRCLQHRGGEPEQAKGADGMQLFALDCIVHIVDAEMD